jgi:hypothetical protein
METTHYNDVIEAPPTSPMSDSKLNNFDPADFLAKAGFGWKPFVLNDGRVVDTLIFAEDT